MANGGKNQEGKVMNRISVSVLNSNLLEIGKTIEAINRSNAYSVHVDVMDGNFVPNISFGMPVTEAMHKVAKKPLDVHLMIEKPERYIDAFVEAGAAYLTVHYEACLHLHRVVQQIKDRGIKAGVALNPHTPVEVLRDILGDLDLVLLMSVNPGFGGQRFIERTFDRVIRLKALIEEVGSKAEIEVDGGVNNTNIPALRKAGVDMFVVGSYIFKQGGIAETINQLSYEE